MLTVVTCVPGISHWLVEELAGWRVLPLKVSPGAVEADISLRQIMDICLGSRLAERVLLPLVQLEVPPQEAAEALATALDTQQLAGASALTVQVDHGRQVRGDERITAGIFLKHLALRGVDLRPGPQALALRLQIGESSSSLLLDLCGEPLSRRGYRLAGAQAPLRETLAAAMLHAAGFPALLASDEILVQCVDPFCGSGTLLIEAALMASGVSANGHRDFFSMFQWQGFCPQEWGEAKAAVLKTPPLAPGRRLVLKGFDANEAALKTARDNARRAGVDSMIHFERRELGQLKSRDFSGRGQVVTNPPWGERLEDKGRAGWLHVAINRILASVANAWPVTLLGADVEVMDKTGAAPVGQWKVANGNVTNFIRQFIPQGRPLADPLLPAEAAFELPPEATAFVNRLKKNGRQLKRWIEQNGIQCYRLYDRDLPEFNVSVDIYGHRVLIQEFKAPKTVDEKAAEHRRQLAVSAVRSVLNVHREQVFLRTRAVQKGKSQYQKMGAERRFEVAREGAAWLLVDMRTYLDTGLFLDHRPVRQMIFEAAAGKRFLNLFAYTGSATVQAALGGASASVTVDASNTYLKWAGDNLALNGFSTERHRLERADAMKWLLDCKQQFDLVFCDPPTFSNNKSRDDFVVQRDHAELISRIMRVLEPGGVLYFSCNLRKFVLDEDVRRSYQVEDLTFKSIPPDFKRHEDIHHLYRLVRS